MNFQDKMTLKETKRRYDEAKRQRWAGWVFQVMLLIIDFHLFIVTQSYFLLFLVGVMIGIVFIGFVDNFILDDIMKFNFWQTRLIYQLLTINRKQQRHILDNALERESSKKLKRKKRSKKN